MTHRVRMVVGVCLAAAAMAGVVLISVSLGRKPFRSPPPNPNGYDDFLKAGEAVTGDVGGVAKLEHDELRDLVATNAESLRLLRIGLSRACALPTDAAMTNLGATVNDLAKFKALALLLAAEGRLAELEERRLDAARSYVQAMALGNEMSRGGFVINRAVGVAVEAIGARPLARLLSGADARQLRPIVDDLERIERSRVSWEEIIANENRLTRRELRKVHNPINWIPTWWQSRPAKQNARTRHLIAVAHLRLFEMEVALRCYRADKGQAPTGLEQLVPAYVAQVSADPFTGRQMIYQPRGTNWVLYSVGMDKVDDGGNPVGKGVSSKGDLFFDSPW